MKRVFPLTPFLLLLVLPSYSFLGCSKSSDESDQTPETTPTFVDYSLAQPLEIPTLKTEKEFEDFIAGSEIAVVKFGAEWCGPCCELSPELRKQAGYFETEDVKFAEVDVDVLGSLASHMRVGSIPDIRVYYEGRPYSQIVGNYPYELANLVESLCVNKKVVQTTQEDRSSQENAEGDQDVSLPTLKTEESFRSFVKDARFAVVKFGADWSPSSRKMDSELRKLAKYYQDADVKFAEINVDELPQLSKEFKIDDLPFVQVYKDGELQNSIIGYDPDGAAQEISKACQKEAPLSGEIDDDKPLEDELWPEDVESDDSEKNSEKNAE